MPELTQVLEHTCLRHEAGTKAVSEVAANISLEPQMTNYTPADHAWALILLQCTLL